MPVPAVEAVASAVAEVAVVAAVAAVDVVAAAAVAVDVVSVVAVAVAPPVRFGCDVAVATPVAMEAVPPSVTEAVAAAIAVLNFSVEPRMVEGAGVVTAAVVAAALDAIT
jgi:hypothetical protein